MMEYSNITGMDGPSAVLSKYVDKTWFKEEHSYRGSYVHNALKNHLLGSWNPPAPAEYQGYIDSGKLWLDANVKDVLMVENGDKTRLVDPQHKYSGQPDVLCTLKINPKPGIVDWKTSLAYSVVWAGQCASYWNLVKTNGYPDACWAAAVRLRKDGRIALADFIQNLSLELQYFLNANAAYRRYVLKTT